MTRYKPSHISHSSLSAYEACPRQYMYRYVMGIEDKEIPLAFVFGGAFHEGLAAHYTGKDFWKAYQVALIKDMKKGHISEAEAKELNRMAVVMFEAFQVYARPFKAKFVEEWFEVPLRSPVTKEALPVPIKGIIDLITEDGEVIDHKTSSAFLNGGWDNDRHTRQLQLYSMAYQQKYKSRPKSLMIQSFLKRKTASKIEYLEIQTDEMEEAVLFETVKATYARIESNDWRATPSYGTCMMCPFNKVCTESAYKKKVRR